MFTDHPEAWEISDALEDLLRAKEEYERSSGKAVYPASEKLQNAMAAFSRLVVAAATPKEP